MGPPFAARVRASLVITAALQANKRAQGLGLDAGDGTRTLRIMIPARFGLAIGNSGPVGTPLDTTAHPAARRSACPRGVAARLGLVDEQADRVVAPGSTGRRRLVVEDDYWRLRQDADIEQPDCMAAGVGGPSSSHRAHVHGWASRWGEGPARRLLGGSRDGRPQARFAPLSPAVAVVRTRRTARSPAVRRESPRELLGTAASVVKTGAAGVPVDARSPHRTAKSAVRPATQRLSGWRGTAPRASQGPGRRGFGSSVAEQFGGD